MINRILPITTETKESFKKFAEQVTGWQIKNTDIKKIKVHTFSNRIKKAVDTDICVGQEIDFNISNSPHEPVVAIFESENEYLVLTPNKNSSSGTVYFFNPKEVTFIEKG